MCCVWMYCYCVVVVCCVVFVDEEFVWMFVWDVVDVFVVYGVFVFVFGIGGDGALEYFRYGYVSYFVALAMVVIYIGLY